MPDPVTSQIPRANLAALIHATGEPTAHLRTTAEMPVAQLEALLVEERKTTPISVTVHADVRERPPLPLRLYVAVGLLSGISIGLACLWA
jgi:hypothetical protein